MSKTINIGIDLGTTNSSIVHFDKGEVRIFKDPVGWRDTLPSVVSFRKDRIIVGQKAKEYIEKSPQNVMGLFKRKMGTNESFKVKSLNKSMSPVELSSYVLKELKTFVQSKDINLDSTVITIPASFDTIQSNATKQAGELAGFKEVVLLQEPIAASLAYANSKNQDLEKTKWIVYDLGGGTFDVALLEIADGEMKVIDHEGDNFLGGSDFDRLIVEKIVIPYLEENYSFSDLKSDLQNASGKYNKLYYRLLNAAEDVKIQLSTKTSAEIELSITDESDEEIDEELIITREEFEKIIKKDAIKTADMIKNILTRNSLRKDDINFILMIGGSTYIPYIRNYISDVLELKIHTDIDPTTAVAVGAAYYAGNKKSEISNKKQDKKDSKIKIKMAYQKSTQEPEEYFAAKVVGNIENFNYRIVREDSSYDSGLKKLDAKITEDLPLLKNAYNFFTLTIYDSFNNPVQTESIEISQGKYTISGQPLPEDICLEVDDYHSDKTKLELVFKKNAILPLKKTITKDINKTISRGSSEELIINILEGNELSIPEANKTLGFVSISGRDIDRDVIKGSDIEITFEMSESRDLTVSAYVSMTDQEFKQVFNPKVRKVSIEKVASDIETLTEEIDESIEFAKENNEYEKIEELYTIKTNLEKVEVEVENLDTDDVTDKRYQVEDQKRTIAQEYYNSIKDEKMQIVKKEYFDIKADVEVLISQYGDYSEQEYFKELVLKEEAYIKSSNISKLSELKEDMESIKFQMNWKQPDFIKGAFAWIAQDEHNFRDQSRANSLIGRGLKELEKNDTEELADITRELIGLLSKDEQAQVTTGKIGFY